jgi:ATP-binding cassette subfamily B protein
VAHRLSTIKNADRIAVLKNGRCEELGSYEELMEKKGLFYAMQTAQ